MGKRPGPLVAARLNYLGAYMRKLRRDSGFSNRFLAEKMNISQTHLYRMEEGYNIPRDKKFIRSWVRFASGGKVDPSTAIKLSMVTYPEMICRIHKLGIEDRIRFLALIQNIHLYGMPKEVSQAIDKSIIEPNGVVVRMKNGGMNIPKMEEGGTGCKKLTYEDYFIDPKDHKVYDAGTLLEPEFEAFLKTPGDTLHGEKPSACAYKAN
jgi:hypothetical protein